MGSSKKYTTGFATSKDGTQIHYRQFGSGEGLILVHGGMMYSQNFMTLAELLADHFTVYVPDRCGRGLSEMDKYPFLLAESEDLQAVSSKTNTQNIFGLSSGAIIVLQTAILNSALKKIALYEPPILIDDDSHPTNRTRYKYEEAVATRNYGRAFVSIVKGMGDDGS